MTVADLSNIAVNAQPHIPNKDSHDTDQMHSLIQPCLSAHSSNYMDCTESNDDDDDDEDPEQTPVPHPSGLAPPPPSCTEMPCSKRTHSDQSKAAQPCWEKFFKAEPVLTDESELDNSQNSHNTQTLSTENTASQSPELFQDEDEDDNSSIHMTSSQSTHISDAGTESLTQMDTVLVHVDEHKAVISEQCNQGTNGEVVSDVIDSSNTEHKTEEAGEPKSDSQVSSDFELPPTPGSKVPQPEDLKDLYRKLAAGEEVIIRQIF